MQISIAMATYNGARFLLEQLESFAEQTRLPDELVITDDGSTDDTAAVVAAFARTAPFAVRFVPNDRRLGFNGNFASAIGLTRGEIVLISDQDDRWYPDKIATVAAVLEDPRWLAVVNDQVIADGEGRETGATVLGNVRAMGRPDSWYGPGCCTAFSRRLLPIVSPFPGDVVAYDHWINVLADAVGARAICETPLQMYRRHDANASGSVFARERAGDLDLLRAARRPGARDAIGRKVAEIDAIIARLQDRRAEIAAFAPESRIAAALTDLTAERDDYAARAALLQRGGAGRLAGATRLLATGRYGRFSGVRTALKDVLLG